jgi:hypothetical protein
MPRDLVQRIEDEGRVWTIAGAKHLAEIIN